MFPTVLPTCILLVFQTIGGLMMGVGFYSITQKNEYTEFTSTSTDPGAVLVAVGFVIFFVSFAGTIGALRENMMLLRIVCTYTLCL